MACLFVHPALPLRTTLACGRGLHRPAAHSERSSSAAAAARPAAPSSRPRGVLPGADYECVRYTGIPYPSGNHLLTRPLASAAAGSGGLDAARSSTSVSYDQQRTPPKFRGGRGAAQAGVPGSPLDDLLVHVNR